MITSKAIFNNYIKTQFSGVKVKANLIWEGKFGLRFDLQRGIEHPKNIRIYISQR